MIAALLFVLLGGGLTFSGVVVWALWFTRNEDEEPPPRVAVLLRQLEAERRLYQLAQDAVQQMLSTTRSRL